MSGAGSRRAGAAAGTRDKAAGLGRARCQMQPPSQPPSRFPGTEEPKSTQPPPRALIHNTCSCPARCCVRYDARRRSRVNPCPPLHAPVPDAISRDPGEQLLGQPRPRLAPCWRCRPRQEPAPLHGAATAAGIQQSPPWAWESSREPGEPGLCRSINQWGMKAPVSIGGDGFAEAA